MKNEPIGRRLFLQGAGGALLALPWLPSLLGRTARAQVPTAPKRFIAIKSYSAQRITDWYPRYAGNGYAARPYARNVGGQDGTTIVTEPLAEASGHRDGSPYYGHFAPLPALAAGGSLSEIIGPGFGPYLERMLLLRGLDFMPQTNHNAGGMLGNFAASDWDYPEAMRAVPTIDQVLAHSPRFYPSTPVGPRALHLSPGNPNTFSFTDGGHGGEVVQAQGHIDPLTAFNEAFAGFAPASPETLDPNIKLVDRVLEDYRNTLGSGRLSAADRQLLQSHMQHMSEVQDRLRAAAAAMHVCAAPTAPAAAQVSTLDPEVLRSVYSAMIDVAVAAIRCDVTRIVTLNVWTALGPGAGPGGADTVYTHVGTLRDAQDWHLLAHEWADPGAAEQVRRINRWIADELLLRILRGLDEPEGDTGSYLDNSLVFWGNELGMNHLNYSVPSLLAGGAGGAVGMGRYIDYIDWQRPIVGVDQDGPIIEGVPYNRLLVSILQAMGLGPADYERDGQPGYGSYAQYGKDAQSYAVDYDQSQYGLPLPGLLSG